MTNATLDPEVEQTLEVLLAPGQKARLSQLVESAQINLLTGQWPDDRRRHDSTYAIIKQNQGLLNKLAETWNDTRRKFSPEDYENPAYLQMYALYYFSVNVSKLQLLLLDLARRGKFTGEIRVLDIGVGAGSSAVALLDFLYAWGLACNLHHHPFPVEAFSLLGVDKSSLAIEFSSRMVSSYGEALHRRMDSFALQNSEQQRSIELLEQIYNWTRNVSWQKLDLDSQPLSASRETNLVVISNVLNELASPALEHVDEFLNALSNGSLAVLIEPGDQVKATGLMQWRAKFLSTFPSLASIAPCGHELHHAQNDACTSCWAVRRESFHQPPLYLAFRNACEKITEDKRSFEDYDNNLLSWSYTILQKGEPPIHPLPLGHDLTLQAGRSLSDPFRMRVLGKFHKKPDQKVYKPLDYPVDKDPYRREERSWNEYYKICPLNFPEALFVALERSQGFQIPRLRYGQEFSAANLDIELFERKANCYRLIPQGDGKTVIDLLEHVTPRQNNGAGGFLSSYDNQVHFTVDELAYRLFGFQGMRAFQHDILSRVLAGKSVLGIAATGGGKSECYILPAMILPGLTVVISPLRSLMTDQYDQRISQRYGLGDLATYINGDVPFQERQARLKRMELGYYKLVYFTPEQLERSYILDSLRRANASTGIRYLAMDEAHCISQWGHDFRPSYLNIVRRLREYGISPTIIALTATASPHVRKDVCEELGLNPLPVDEGGDVFVYSSNRPEINLEVRVKHTTDEKVSDILDELRLFQRENQNNQNPGSALVFMPHTGGSPDNTWRYFPKKLNSRQGRNSAGVTGFASYLERKLGRRLAIYHGKMESEVEEPEELVGESGDKKKPIGDLSGRTRVQEQTKFINSVSTGVDIMVATKGFGMGIDKPNIRLVVHRSPTTNMEAYAQEAGRAGRDGEMATAILYYSPDSTTDGDDEVQENGEKSYQQNVKSDHQIQEDFLSGRYIRREDVIVMRAFLQQVEHRLPIQGENGLPDRTYLYFSCDEAMEFFDQCQSNPAKASLSTRYEWPQFPLRETNEKKEFGQHKEILDRGHVYTNKTRYLNRILAALFRIRPAIAGQPNRAFLESVQETGARVRIHEYTFMCNWPAVYHSNAYFGEMLRKRQVTESEFRAAMEAGDLLAFAKRMNLTIKELVSILNDIKSTEGRFVNGRWRGDLLNFTFISAPLFGPAENKDDLRSWRDYAGAYRRSPTPKENAKRNRHQTPTIDDYFSWRDVSKSVGWEVLPGSAFEINFQEFLNLFMQLHDERMQNDWASYYRLLTDYIGVRDDGSVPLSHGQRDCLRSVLLGYLESYEVVVDGQCYSCSHCVPDGNYGKHEWEKREKAVTRMKAGLISLFKELKEYEEDFPPLYAVQNFFEQMAAEEAEGRALYRYFIGWSGKLLDDSPDHRAAKWLRLEAMAEGLLSFQPQEFIKYAHTLKEVLESADLQRLDQTVRKTPENYKDDPSLRALLAEIAQKLGDFEREADLLQEQIKQLQNQPSTSGSWLYASATRLLELHGKHVPLPQPLNVASLQMLAGRTATSEEDSRKWYIPVVQDWHWEELSNELESQAKFNSPPHSQAALCLTWAGSSTERWATLGQWIGDQPDVIIQWSDASQSFALDHISLESLILYPKLGLQAISKSKDPERTVRLGTKLWATGEKLTPQIRRRIAEKMILIPQSARSILDGLSDEILGSLLSSMNSVVEFSDWNALEAWLDLQPAKTLSSEYALQWLETGLRQLPPPPKTTTCINRLGKLLEALISQEHLAKQALDAWLPIALKNLDGIEIHETLNDYISCIARNSPGWADAFPKYQLVIRDWDWNRLVAEIDSLDQKCVSEIPILKLLAIWLQFHIEEEHYVEEYICLKASTGRWPLQVVQSLTHDIHLNLIQSLNLAIEWSDKVNNSSSRISEPEKFLDVVFKLTAANYKLPREVIEFSRAIFKMVIPSNREALFQRWFSEPAKINKLINTFFDKKENIPVPLALFWLNKIDAEEIVSFPTRIADKTLQSIADGFDQIPQNALVIKNLRQQLGSLIDEMMEDPATRLLAHQHWVKLCEFWPEEAVLHMRHCLILEPPEGKFAEECLDLIMSYNKAPLIQELVKLFKQKELKGVSNRIDRLIDLIQSMRDLEINSDITEMAKLESRHLAMIFNIFKPKTDPYQADMASELIKLLRERIYSNWKTPLAYQVEALVYGNHIDDARKIAEPSLAIGKERLPLNDFINFASKKLRSVPDYRNDYYKMFSVLTSRWKFREL